MDRLIVCGWDDALEPLLEALRAHASLRATAVGDVRTADLVRARTATRLPCYQHIHQMVDGGDFDAALIGDSDLAGELAGQAAAGGAALLLLGNRMDAHGLESAASAATRYGVPLAVLRPALSSAGYSFVTNLVTVEPRWVPTVLDVEIRDEGPTIGALRDALAVTTRLITTMPMTVAAAAAGLDAADPLALSAQLRYADGSLVTLAARSGVAPALRIAAQAPAGTVEVRVEHGQSRFTITPWNGRAEESVQRNPPAMQTEADRVARVRNGEDLDALCARREAAILQAIENALDSGSVEGVELPGVRPSFRVLPGGVEMPSPRIGALHLV